MSASYPASNFTWTDRVDAVDDVLAADINTLAAEIDAIEDDLVGTGVASGLKQAAASFNANWQAQHSTAGAHLANAISIVQFYDNPIANTDTLALVFDFVPSKIVLDWKMTLHTDSDRYLGMAFGNSVITITGTDAYTIVSNLIEPYAGNQTYIGSCGVTVNNTTNVAECYGNDGSGASITGTGAWVTSTKTFTITWAVVNVSSSDGSFMGVATAYK